MRGKREREREGRREVKEEERGRGLPTAVGRRRREEQKTINLTREAPYQPGRKNEVEMGGLYNSVDSFLLFQCLLSSYVIFRSQIFERPLQFHEIFAKQNTHPLALLNNFNGSN